MVKRVKDGTSMWNRQYVYRNGDLMLCHNDYHRVHPVGNIADKSLRWKAATSACRSAICECYVPKMGLTIQ